jgi:hypothetical protein
MIQTLLILLPEPQASILTAGSGSASGRWFAPDRQCSGGQALAFIANQALKRSGRFHENQPTTLMNECLFCSIISESFDHHRYVFISGTYTARIFPFNPLNTYDFLLTVIVH